MATASMQNRNPRQQQSSTSASSSAAATQPTKFKPQSVTASSSASSSPATLHNRESSNDRQENKTTWGRKTSAAGTPSAGTATLVNRATTPQNSTSRTNSPTPAQPPNAWTAKADERHSHDQFTHLLYTLLSQSILLHTRAGSSYTGILTHFDFQPELALVLSHVLPYPIPDPAPPAKKHLVVLPKEISSIAAQQVSLLSQTYTSSQPGFRTDTAISGATTSAQRPLEKWQPDPAPALGGMSGSLDQIAVAGAGWDQFATNERMFGVKTSYHEELYTTKLDRSHPEFERRLRQADSIAREIEGKVSSNPHVQEERNQKVDDSGVDEEDKYAGVIRGKGGVPTPPPPAVPAVMAYAAAAAGNKYTPPAKRTETTLKSAPHSDPAIISSKLQTTPKTPQTPVETDPTIPTSTEKSDENPKPTSSANGTATTTPVPQDPSPPPPSATAPALSVQEPPQIQEVGQKFVKEEKVKLKRARNLIGTKEKQRQFAEFAQFSSSLTLNMPVPSDLLPILAGKDANKQKAILERNQELKRRAEEVGTGAKKGSAPTSPAVGGAVVAAATGASPVVSPGPTLAERLKANQGKGVVSPIASPTPLERPVQQQPQQPQPQPQQQQQQPQQPQPGTVLPKKLDPSAKEFVFKVSAKEFKPSFATPSTHSPSPSRSSVVSPTPARGLSAHRVEEKPRLGFKDRKPRKDAGKRTNGDTVVDTFPPRGEEKKMLAAYTTHPAWPLAESDDPNAKGYLDIMTEGKSLPPTPTSGPDDTSQSGHNYSRSSSVHPHHSTPHPPPQLPTQPPNVVQYPTGLNPMYPNMGPQVTLNQYGQYMISQPQQIPMHPQGVPQPGFTPQLLPGQFQQHQQAGPYPRFQQQAYGSVSPSPMMQHAIPAQYAPQQAYAANGQFPQAYPGGPMYPGVVPGPYGFVPQQQPQQQQQNGAFSGHPSPGRAATQAQMVYSGMQGLPPMNMVSQQIYQDPNMMRHQQPYPQGPQQMSLRTPPQPPHIPPAHQQGGYQHSPSRNNSYASAAGHATPSHSRRQSTQPQLTEDDK